MNIAIVLAVILILFGLAFIFYKKIIGVNVLILNLLFPILFVICIVSLFWAQPYNSVSEILISNTPVAAELKNIDSSFSQMDSFSKSITDSIKYLIPDAQPLNLKTTLFQQYIDLFAVVLRITVIIICFAGVILITYLRYVFASTFELSSLDRKVSKLEKEIEALKANKTNLQK